jgi:hypothetical protein
VTLQQSRTFLSPEIEQRWGDAATSYVRLSALVLFEVHLNREGSPTWSVTLKEERRLRTFEDRALRKTLGPERREITVDENRLARNFVIFILRQISLD